MKDTIIRNTTNFPMDVQLGQLRLPAGEEVNVSQMLRDALEACLAVDHIKAMVDAGILVRNDLEHVETVEDDPLDVLGSEAEETEAELQARAAVEAKAKADAEAKAKADAEVKAKAKAEAEAATAAKLKAAEAKAAEAKAAKAKAS